MHDAHGTAAEHAHPAAGVAQYVRQVWSSALWLTPCTDCFNSLAAELYFLQRARTRSTSSCTPTANISQGGEHVTAPVWVENMSQHQCGWRTCHSTSQQHRTALHTIQWSATRPLWLPSALLKGIKLSRLPCHVSMTDTQRTCISKYSCRWPAAAAAGSCTSPSAAAASAGLSVGDVRGPAEAALAAAAMARL
jgi:hypothetical protein